MFCVCVWRDRLADAAYLAEHAAFAHLLCCVPFQHYLGLIVSVSICWFGRYSERRLPIRAIEEELANLLDCHAARAQVREQQQRLPAQATRPTAH